MAQRKRWNRLDNVAKIFPPTTSNRGTNVFRFMCELTEDVDGATLKKAVEQTLPDFPLYRSVLKKGLFWYYFEESDYEPQVTEETLPACSPLYNADKPGLLFRVMYYKQRINLEVFHALADGSGAIQFLRAMVFHYLVEKYALQGYLADYDASPEQKAQDAFYKHYDKTGNVSKASHRRAYRIHGERLPDNRKGIIEGIMSVRAVLDKAHEHNASLSEYLIAQQFCAIFDNMAVREYKKPVIITVPVDLRKYFPAQTACNFFANARITHNFLSDGQTFDTVLENIQKSLRQQLTKDNLAGIIARYSKIENNPVIKAVPLPIKIPYLALAGIRAEGEDTAVFSNTGIISMPEEASKYIKLFSVCISAKRPQFSLCSYGDILIISVSSPFADTVVERCFFKSLTKAGINVQVVSNLEQFNEEEATHATL